MEEIALILFAVAVGFYAMSQAVMHGKLKDNPDSKYASPKRPGKGLYYKLTGVKYAEKFPLSATLLVSLTDKYHKFQLGFKMFLCAGIVLHTPLFGYWDALLLFVGFGIVFTITYRLASMRCQSKHDTRPS
jgi:hypothetical protein